MARRITREDAITAATLARLPPEILLGVWQQESSGRSDGVPDSPKGAIGPFQVMPDTFRRYMPKGSDIRNPVDNMMASIAVLSDGWQKSGGDVKKTGQFYYHGRFLPAGKRGPTSGPGTPDTFEYGEQFAEKVAKERKKLGNSASLLPRTPESDVMPEGYSRPVYERPTPDSMDYLNDPMNRPYNMTEQGTGTYDFDSDPEETEAMRMYGADEEMEEPPDPVGPIEEPNMPRIDIAGFTRPLSMEPEPMEDEAAMTAGSQDYELDNFIRSLVDEEFRNSRDA